MPTPEDVEVIELFESAKKAGDSAVGDEVPTNGPEVERCVDALKQLGNYPITYEILVSSQVGKRLRALTKHPIEKIRNTASDLLESWKQLVVEETTRRKKAEKASAEGGGEVEKSSNVKVEETVKVEKIVKEERGASLVKKSPQVVIAPPKRRPETVKVEKTIKQEQEASFAKKPPQGAAVAPPKHSSLVRCNDDLRDKYRVLLVEAMEKVSAEVDDDLKHEVNTCDPFRVAVAVETTMFEKLGKSNGAQKAKYRSIMFNLKDPKNPDLRRKVLLGQVNPERLVTMTPEEMASDQRQQENKQIKEKALFDCQVGGPPKATTDQFRCGRCGQRKTTYYQMQTRSADEPMTTYVTCVNCNKHWKFC
ncbi:Transcription elongation factor TFIIS [Linum perenne]